MKEITEKKTPKTKLVCWIFLIIALSVNMLSIDIYLPAMPTMMADLSTSSFFLKLIFIINFLEFSFAPLMFGGFSDVKGRKPILYVCLTLALLGQLLSAISFNPALLMVSRIVQYLGAGALSSIILTLICDNFEGIKRAKSIAVYEIALPFALSLGPFVGAFILKYWGWRGSFLMLSCIQIICFMGLMFTFSETLTISHRVKIKQTLMCIFDVIKDPISSRIILILGLVEGAWMIFTISSAFFYIKTFNISLLSYAYYQSAPVICFLLGASLYRILVNNLNPTKIFHYSIFGYLLSGSCIFFLKEGFIISSPMTLSITCSTMNFFCGIICPTGNSIIFDRVNKNFIGTSAGVIACLINLIVGASMLGGNYVTGPDLTTSFFNCILCSVFLIGLLWVSLRRYDTYKITFG